LIFCFLAAFTPISAAATYADLPRLVGKVEVDGILSDGEWADAVQIELDIETDPAENGPAPVRTVVYLVEDGENLFIAFDAHDPDPGAIRAYLRDRDSAWEDDHVGIILDTYNDERHAFEFYANPLGVQMDKILDDVNARHSWEIDASWDAIWESAGEINEAGYVVEMRIPLSQLRFPDVGGEKTWGYSLTRSYPRDRTYLLSNHALDRNLDCYLCQIGTLQGLEGSTAGRDFELVPTITVSKNDTTDDPGFEPMQSGDPDAEIGLTARWGITPDLTGNVTINPDFSQVEADVAQLDINNRFTLFFPEKRPFFLEGTDYFTTPIRAVFTRTVSDPDIGLKLTGKKGANTFGVFAAQDAVTNLLFPGLYSSDTETLEESHTAFVGRYSRGFGEASSIGGLVTARDGDDYHNYVGSIDARWKISDQHSVEFQHLQSDTEYPLLTAIEFEQPLESFSGQATHVSYQYKSRNWYGDAGFSSIDSEFRADSGFVSQVGGERSVISFGRLFYGTEDTWWNRIRTQLNYHQTDSEDGELVDRDTTFRFSVQGPMQSWVSVALQGGEERDAGILYDLRRVRVYFDFQPTRGVSLSLFTIIGDQIDYDNGRLGKQKYFEPNVTWNMTRNLLLRLKAVITTLDTQDGEKIFDAVLADTRLTWQFNLRSFLRLTVQYQDVERNQDVYVEPIDASEKDVGRQLLYSYKLNPQTVFFLGYSDQYADNDSLSGLTVSDRTWFMKIGYAWTP
jgi:hypothetical protein